MISEILIAWTALLYCFVRSCAFLKKLMTQEEGDDENLIFPFIVISGLAGSSLVTFLVVNLIN